MKKESNHTQMFLGMLIVALSFFPAAALARDGESSGVSASVNVSAHLEVEGNETASANSSTTVRLREEDRNDRSDEASSTRRQDGEHRSDNSLRESDEQENEISINHRSAENASTTIEAPERVTNYGELRSFLNHVVKEDNRIADVHVSSTTVETRYAMPAKFLWAIPVDLTANVSVKSDGSVTVTYPWYAFLFATKGDELAAQLTQAASTTTATSSTTFSASTQAHLLNLLFSTLKSSIER